MVFLQTSSSATLLLVVAAVVGIIVSSLALGVVWGFAQRIRELGALGDPRPDDDDADPDD